MKYLSYLIASGDPPKLFELTNVFGNALTAFLAIGGILTFIMFVTAGFHFISAGGDPKAIAQAWQTLTFAVVGLILVVGAFLILTFVANFTGANAILNFNIFQN